MIFMGSSSGPSVPGLSRDAEKGMHSSYLSHTYPSLLPGMFYSCSVLEAEAKTSQKKQVF